MASEIKLFAVLMRLEGSVQLYKSGLQVQEQATKKYKDYYLRNVMFHKEMIELYSKMLKWETTPEEIVKNKFPVIDQLLDFPPYLEYLKGIDQPKKTRSEKQDLPFYI